MNISKWLDKNTHSLIGKKVAVSGATGGIGRVLCTYLAKLEATLILVDRNIKKSLALAEELRSRFPSLKISHVQADMEDMETVKAAAKALLTMEIDFLILNAGAYSIPRHKCSEGYDNVFTINYIAPYYLASTLLPNVRQRGGKIIAVGSIAYRYSKTDEKDVDFSTRKKASLVYGNAKRRLMVSFFDLGDGVSVTHPGITFTNITAHYPKLIFALIKHPMKVIFMSPEKAALSIVKGFFAPTEYHTWYGPRLFNVWGLPSKKKLTTCSESESKRIAEISETVYRDVKNKIASNKNEVKG